MELIRSYLEEQLAEAQQAQQGSPASLVGGGAYGAASEYAGGTAGGDVTAPVGGDAVDFWTVLNLYSHVT
jgi:hypothetical protein